MKKNYSILLMICFSVVAFKNSYASMRCGYLDNTNLCVPGVSCVTVVIHNDDYAGRTWAGMGFSDLGNTWNCGGNENDITRSVPKQKLQFGYRYYSLGTDYRCLAEDRSAKINMDGIFYIDLDDYNNIDYPNGIKVIYKTPSEGTCTYTVVRN